MIKKLNIAASLAVGFELLILGADFDVFMVVAGFIFLLIGFYSLLSHLEEK